MSAAALYAKVRCRTKAEKIMLELGYDTRQLAERAGLTHTMVWRTVCGRTKHVRLAVARKIAKALGKTVDELWP